MQREHTIDIRVRYKETDAMGILHHSNYFTYFEMGRTELLRKNGIRYRDMEADGVFVVVVRINCKYHQPARYDDVLALTTTTTRVSAAKIEHAYQVTRDGVLIAEGQSTLACVDRDGKVRRVPDSLQTES